MYTASTSGRSSRSTLTGTKRLVDGVATSPSSNDSCAMTWHQWHAAYPTESRIGTSRRRASANASSPHSHQSTGLSACWRRYGLREPASRFAIRPPYPRRRAAEDGSVVERLGEGDGGRDLVGVVVVAHPDDLDAAPQEGPAPGGLLVDPGGLARGCRSGGAPTTAARHPSRARRGGCAARRAGPTPGGRPAAAGRWPATARGPPRGRSRSAGRRGRSLASLAGSVVSSRCSPRARATIRRGSASRRSASSSQPAAQVLERAEGRGRRHVEPGQQATDDRAGRVDVDRAQVHPGVEPFEEEHPLARERRHEAHGTLTGPVAQRGPAPRRCRCCAARP